VRGVSVKPGDLIEWTYRYTGGSVVAGETMWSTPLDRWVPVGGDLFHMLVAITSDTITWLNSRGLFHALLDDDIGFDVRELWTTHEEVAIVPRPRGDT
jgi:hypothetical protein